mgnify:CR=1 FL=1
MTFRGTPEYKLPYEDRLTEETWAIAGSKRAYAMSGSKWEPWKLNLVTVNLADVLSGRKEGLDITIPDEDDYNWARQRVDMRIDESLYCLDRLKRAKIVYVPLPRDFIYINPGLTQLNASWNGMRDPLAVDEFFFLTGHPDEELKTVFHYDPENMPPGVRYSEGFFGFTSGGRQRLAAIVGKPIAFVYLRKERRRRFTWDLSSKEMFYP